VTLAGLDSSRAGHLVLARVTGEVDMSNAEELRLALSDLTPNDVHGLILDMSEVEYLDSAGIHLVYRLRDALRSRGQGLRIVIPRDSVVNDTLRLAGITRNADIVATVEEARSALDPDLAR
jgi:anti-sigma B factor antagonist